MFIEHNSQIQNVTMLISIGKHSKTIRKLQFEK